MIEPGQVCPTCERRVNHPKKATSPVSKPVSYRVPLDEVDAHDDVAVAAAKHLGVYERPHWRYQLNTLAYVLVLQDESLRGYAHRSPSLSESTPFVDPVTGVAA